jgi:hypothetical protein
VVFYTDGLIERRGADSDDALSVIRKCLAEASVRPDALERLRPVLHTASSEDDTCTLAARIL